MAAQPAMERASCYLDLFCMRRSDVEVRTLQDIVSCADPERPGIWERLVGQKYQRFMLSVISDCIRYAVTKTKDPYLNSAFIFFVFMGFEPACQRIITKQLQRANLTREHAFFTQEFVKFARHSIVIMLRYPITLDDAHHVFNTCVSLLQVTWLTKCTYFSVISTRFEVETREREIKRRAEDSKLKDALKVAGRIKRGRV